MFFFQRWKTEPALDFDLTDPNLHKYPSTLTYDPRCDVHLRSHMAKHRVQKMLRRQGLINEDGTIECSLRDYNGYRNYLHELKMKHVKRRRVIGFHISSSYSSKYVNMRRLSLYVGDSQIAVYHSIVSDGVRGKYKIHYKPQAF
jgi:hypothetical protein